MPHLRLNTKKATIIYRSGEFLTTAGYPEAVNQRYRRPKDFYCSKDSDLLVGAWYFKDYSVYFSAEVLGQHAGAVASGLSKAELSA